MSLLKSVLKHAGKEKVKVQFDIQVLKVSNLNEYNSKTVSLVWRRGSAKHAGTLKDVVVANGEASWNEKIVLKSTLYKDPDTGKFDDKSLAFSLKQNGATIAKTSLELGNYSKHESNQLVEISFNNKKPKSPTIHVNIQSRWLKINDKVIVKQPSTTAIVEENGIQHTTSQGNHTVEVEGQPFNLKTEEVQTESLDTTTATGSWEEEDGDPFASTGLFEAEVKRAHEEVEALRKQLRLVEGESIQRVKTIELQEKELVALRHKLEMVEAKCGENEELIQRAYGLESFMQQQLALAQQGYEENMKNLKATHATEIAALQARLSDVLNDVQVKPVVHVQTKEQEVQVETVPVEDVASETKNEEVVEAKKEIRVEVKKGVVKKEPEVIKKEGKQAGGVDAEFKDAEGSDLSPAPSGADIERVVAERDELSRRVESLLSELDKSAFSLIKVTTQMAEKEKTINALNKQNKSLQQQLDSNVQRDGDGNGDEARVVKYSRKKSYVVPQQQALPPLFPYPVLDRYWPLVVIFVFFVLLSLGTVIF